MVAPQSMPGRSTSPAQAHGLSDQGAAGTTRGFAIAILLSLPVWALIVWAVWEVA
jgi:hypothetical protein